MDIYNWGKLLVKIEILRRRLYEVSQKEPHNTQKLLQVSRCLDKLINIYQRKSMADKSVIIIGAGMAGLSAGVYGRINGYRTRIFEHHAVSGGVITAWKRKDYTINYAPHFMWDARPGESIYDLYRDSGILPECHFYNCLHFRLTDEGSGKTVVLPRDLEGLAAELKALSPPDVPLIEELMAATRALGKAGLGDIGMDKPPDLSGILDSARQMWGMRRVMKYFGGKFGRPVSDYVRGVRNPFLKRVLKYAFLPDVPVWFLCMVFALYAESRTVLVDGPSLNVARAVEKRYLELGGIITFKATVDKIWLRTGGLSGFAWQMAVSTKLTPSFRRRMATAPFTGCLRPSS